MLSIATSERITGALFLALLGVFGSTLTLGITDSRAEAFDTTFQDLAESQGRYLANVVVCTQAACLSSHLPSLRIWRSGRMDLPWLC